MSEASLSLAAILFNYMNGVPTKEINAIVDKYQYGSFNGSIDLYEYDNCRDDIPQVKYVQVQRDIAPETRQQFKSDIAKKFGIKDENNEDEWRSVFGIWSDQVIWQEIQNKNL